MRRGLPGLSPLGGAGSGHGDWLLGVWLPLPALPVLHPWGPESTTWAMMGKARQAAWPRTF